MAGGANLAWGFRRWLERDLESGVTTPIDDLRHMVEKEPLDPVFPIRLGMALLEQKECDFLEVAGAIIDAHRRMVDHLAKCPLDLKHNLEVARELKSLFDASSRRFESVPI